MEDLSRYSQNSEPIKEKIKILTMESEILH